MQSQKDGSLTDQVSTCAGEMYDNPHDVTSWYNLPRSGGVAYASQESWVLNATIKVKLSLHHLHV